MWDEPAKRAKAARQNVKRVSFEGLANNENEKWALASNRIGGSPESGSDRCSPGEDTLAHFRPHLSPASRARIPVALFP